MKVPPKSPSYSKDRTLTRRTVKGAAGGMLGVDYEDTRHNDPNTLRAHTERASAGKGDNRDGSAAQALGAAVSHAKGGGGEAEPEVKIGGPKEEQEMVLDDEDATTRDAKKRQRQQFIARDRLTVDKDAPELRRTRELWKKIMGEDEEEADDEAFSPAGGEEPEDIDLEAIGEAISSAGDEAPLDRAKLFAKPGKSRIGDPSLVDPAEIRRVLRAPIAYAKHVMVLGEAFSRTTGARREEVVGYMAAMYAALPDRRFARQALKEFGPATGILDVYPLEIVEEIVLRYPGRLPKVGFGQLFARPTRDPRQPIDLVEGRSRIISYPKNLKVRGFAIKGGGNPGYLFEPDEASGRYRLRVDTPGRYEVMISALTKSGHAIIDRLKLNVRPAGRRPRTAAGRVEAPPPRDEAKVAAWPRPVVPPTDPTELLADRPEKTQDGLLSTGELVSRRQQDSMRGPKGEAHEDFGYRPEEAAARGATPAPRRSSTPDPGPGDRDAEDQLSHAEQAILRLALATQITADDLVALPLDASAPEDPETADADPEPDEDGESSPFSAPVVDIEADPSPVEPAPSTRAPSSSSPAGPNAPRPASEPSASTPFAAPVAEVRAPEPGAEAPSPATEVVAAVTETSPEAEPSAAPPPATEIVAAITETSPEAERVDEVPSPPAEAVAEPKPEAAVVARAPDPAEPSPPTGLTAHGPDPARPEGPPDVDAEAAHSNAAIPPPRPASGSAPRRRGSGAPPSSGELKAARVTRPTPPPPRRRSSRARPVSTAPRALTPTPAAAPPVEPLVRPPSPTPEAPTEATPSSAPLVRPPSPTPAAPTEVQTSSAPLVRPPSPTPAAPTAAVDAGSPPAPSPAETMVVRVRSTPRSASAPGAPARPPEPFVAPPRPSSTREASSAPEPFVAAPRARTPPPLQVPAARVSSPMDEPDATAQTAPSSPPSGGFVAARADLPPAAAGETDAEVPVYVPPAAPEATPAEPLVRPPPSDQRKMVTEVVRARSEPSAPTSEPPQVKVDDLVLDDEPTSSGDG